VGCLCHQRCPILYISRKTSQDVRYQFLCNCSSPRRELPTKYLHNFANYAYNIFNTWCTGALYITKRLSGGAAALLAPDIALPRWLLETTTILQYIPYCIYCIKHCSIFNYKVSYLKFHSH